MAPSPIYCRPSKEEEEEEEDDTVEKSFMKAALEGNLCQLKVDIFTKGNGDHLDVCKYLMEELGGDVNALGCGVEALGMPPFMTCPQPCNVAIDRGGNLMKADDNGYTVLHSVVVTGYCEVTEFLLSKGVPVDLDRCHGTPPFMAASSEQDKPSKILSEHHANSGIMGGGKRKDARVEDKAEILQKAPRLELPVAHLAGSNDVTLLELSSNSKGHKCNHVLIGIAELNEILDEILSAEDPPVCEECCPETPKANHVSGVGGGIMVCTECNIHFCAGVFAKSNPQGHARWHANQEQHWVSLVYNEPFDGYCFSCEHTLTFHGSDCEKKEKHGVSGDAGGCLSELVNGDGYIIRGMPNLGFTCYMNALVQCLLALGKLRTKMLQDAPSGSLGACLKDLFVEKNLPTDGEKMMKLKTENLLNAVRTMDARFTGAQDSYDLFMSMCRCFDEVDKNKLACMEGGAPSPMVPASTTSIFSIQLRVTIRCKCCQHESELFELFYNLSASMPSKGLLDTSVISQPMTKGCRSPKKPQSRICTELLPAVEKSDTQKMQKVAEGGDSQSPDSELGEVVMGTAAKTLQIDCTELKISRSKEAVHGPLQTLKEVVDYLPASLDENFEEVDAATAKFHCPGLINSFASIEDCIISNHFNGGEVERRCGNCTSTEGIETTLISKLPSVLIVHVKRYEIGNKLRGHISFKDTIDVGSFMDPRSEDKEKAWYRLVGVIEHVGPGPNDGHYIAYVRAGQKKQSSGSSSWCCADDSTIKEATLEKVFSCEAYLLFYERMED